MAQKVKFTIELKSGGPQKSFVLQINPDWAPLGAARFMDLVADETFDGGAFYRVVPDFMCQFGIPAGPAKYSKWSAMIKDDPVTQKNTRGRISYAMRGPDTRSCQVFINFGDNSSLDSQGFAPFGEVIEGMDVVDQICNQYGDAPYREPVKEQGANKTTLQKYGNLSYVVSAVVEP
jgi:peptidyl-prolyl cis-trans isomerase A (cyclophilin A)